MGLDVDPKPIAQHFSAFIEGALTRYERPLRFTCCFCNRSIVTAGFDPCVFSLRSFVHGQPNEQAVQDFYCHATCLSTAMHPAIRSWVLAAVRSD